MSKAIGPLQSPTIAIEIAIGQSFQKSAGVPELVADHLVKVILPNQLRQIRLAYDEIEGHTPNFASISESISGESPSANTNTRITFEIQSQRESLETAANFLFRAGFHSSLLEVCFECLNKIGWSERTWSLVAESLARQEPNELAKIRQMFLQGVLAEKMGPALARCPSWEQSVAFRLDRQKSFLEAQTREKLKGLRELEILESQKLWDSAQDLLAKLERQFHGDLDMEKTLATRMQQMAKTQMSEPQSPKRSGWKASNSAKNPRVEMIRLEMQLGRSEEALCAEQFSNSAFGQLATTPLSEVEVLKSDLAHAWVQSDVAEAAARLLQSMGDEIFKVPGLAWLFIESLIESRQYPLALEYIQKYEVKNVALPEAVFECIYWRAQAEFGLGNALVAIQNMETLLSSKGSYRQAATLLAEWRAPA